MKILVTGSNGQLGSDLVPLLAAQGHDAAGADISGSGALALDITDREKTISSVVRLRPEVIINCAAYTAVDRAEKEPEAALAVNRDGPANLADAAGEVRALLIHISTDFVFNGSRTSLMTSPRQRTRSASTGRPSSSASGRWPKGCRNIS